MAFTRVPVGSLPRGLKGDQGDKGNPGVNSVANDTATAAQLLADETETRAALRRVTMTNGGLYKPNMMAGLRWRTTLTQMRSGDVQAHVAVLGDSISSTGAPMSNPKYGFNWPGRLRRMFDREFGPGGTGMVICDWDIKDTPAYDDRFAYNAPINAGYGFFQHGALQFAAEGSYMQFTATADDFYVLGLAGPGGANTALVDGVSAGTFRNVGVGGPAISIEREGGTHSNHILTKIPAGARGVHTLKVAPPAGTFATFMGFEGRINTTGTIRLSNVGVSGVSLASLFGWEGANDEAGGFYGLPMIDVLNADLLIIALGINDWNLSRPISELKADLGTLISRQMAGGTNAGGGNKAAGDVLLVFNPQPDIVGLMEMHPSAPAWELYREAFYEIADQYNVPLLDMGERWKDFATGDAIGMFGDGIHLSDDGAYDVAPAVRNAILGV